MTEKRTCAELWPEARGLLLPYEGSASQLYVLDLPLKCLVVVLDKLSGREAHPQVITLDHQSAEPVALTRDLQRAILSSSEKSTCHVLKGDWLPNKELRLWFWINGPAATFDLELVFWANLLFPHPEDNVVCVESFCEIVAFAESFRGLNPKSECALSASETDDPRNHRDTSWTLFW